MKVVIANFGDPVAGGIDYEASWATHVKPPRVDPPSLFDQRHNWGFHIYALGTYLLNHGVADEVEFWDFADDRGTEYHANGILRVMFHDADDVQAYLNRHGYPRLYINYGSGGQPILDLLENKTFRVHVPTLRQGRDRIGNTGAECYLVDSEEFYDERCMMYIPVSNTLALQPTGAETKWDFIYLAACYEGKRHDLLVKAARESGLSGHLHPVDSSELDLAGTRITTTRFNEMEVPHLLHASRIAVYPGDLTSSPASMWECVAAGLPIVVNENIRGGKHLVVSGVTGELASEDEFGDVMLHVLTHRESYSPRKYFEEKWDTVDVLESYLRFFRQMGWRASGNSLVSA
ncbi:MAG: hypothetical protein ABI556_09605 [Gemmatimonadales bacterium]